MLADRRHMSNRHDNGERNPLAVVRRPHNRGEICYLRFAQITELPVSLVNGRETLRTCLMRIRSRLFSRYSLWPAMVYMFFFCFHFLFISFFAQRYTIDR